MNKPSITIGPLHFEDLDPSRFEDLCFLILYNYKKWLSIEHIGKKGSDDGIDIRAIEDISNGSERLWYIQCKRYQKFTLGDFKSIIKKIMDNSPFPEVILVIFSCNVSKRTQDSIEKYAKQEGLPEYLLMGHSDLQALLYSHRQDLLYAFFGISLVHEALKQETIWVNSLQLKKSLKHDFLEIKYRDHNAFGFNKEEVIEYQEIIIHSIDDVDYPNPGKSSLGFSTFYKAYFFGFYYGGIELTTWLMPITKDKDGYWSVSINAKDNIHFACEIIRIPYRNIVTYDLDGDEFYNCPHIYCKYSEGGKPHEQVIFREYSKSTYMLELDINKRILHGKKN